MYGKSNMSESDWSRRIGNMKNCYKCFHCEKGKIYSAHCYCLKYGHIVTEGDVDEPPCWEDREEKKLQQKIESKDW